MGPRFPFSVGCAGFPLQPCLVTDHPSPVALYLEKRLHDLWLHSLSKDARFPLLAPRRPPHPIPRLMRLCFSPGNSLPQWSVIAFNSTPPPPLNNDGAKLFPKLTLPSFLSSLQKTPNKKIVFKRCIFFRLECKLLEQGHRFLYVLLCLVHCKCSINIDDGRQRVVVMRGETSRVLWLVCLRPQIRLGVSALGDLQEEISSALGRTQYSPSLPLYRFLLTPAPGQELLRRITLS